MNEEIVQGIKKYIITKIPVREELHLNLGFALHCKQQGANISHRKVGTCIRKFFKSNIDLITTQTVIK